MCKLVVNVMVLVAAMASAANVQAQSGIFYPEPPTEYPRILGPRLPLRDAPAPVPGCTDEPPFSEWRVIQPLKRWFVGTWEDVALPSWSWLVEPARITRGPEHEWVLTLDETYYSTPADPSAYDALAPGCRALESPWSRAIPYVEAAYQCSATSASGRDFYVLFAAHPDGLVVKAKLPAGPDGEPGCAGLRMMASLNPLRGGHHGCRGRCTIFEGRLRIDTDVRFFEASEPMMHGEIRRLYEVVPVGEDRFEVALRSFSRSSFRLDGSEYPDTMVFLGSELPAWTDRDDNRISRGGYFLTYPTLAPHWLPMGLGVSVHGEGSRFERGLRFVEKIIPDFSKATRLVTPGAATLEPVSWMPGYVDVPAEPAPDRSRTVALLLFAFAALLSILGWRRWQRER